MEELEVIVQRMIDAGEPEENIKLVIEEYSRRQGKLAGVAETDATVAPEPIASESTGSNLEDGSLDLDIKDRSIPKTPQGELVYGDQRSFDQQIIDFQKNYNDAILGQGKYSFLADKPKADRLLFADKMVSKPRYFSSVYNKSKDKYEVKPSKGMYDRISSYLPDDFNLYDTPEQFNQALEDGRAQALQQDPIVTQMLESRSALMSDDYKEWEANKRNEWDLTTEEGVIAANKEANEWFLKNIVEPVENSQTFKRVFNEYTDVTEAIMGERHVGYGRSKDPFLSKDPSSLREGWRKGWKQFGLGFEKAGLSAEHGALEDYLVELNGLLDKDPNEEVRVKQKASMPASAYGAVSIKPDRRLTAEERSKELIDLILQTQDNIKGKVKNIAGKEAELGLYRAPDYDDGISLEDILLTTGEAGSSLVVVGGSAALSPFTGGASGVLGLTAMFGSIYGQNYYDTILQGLKEDGIDASNPEFDKLVAEAISEGKYANRAEVAGFAAVETGLERLGAAPLVKNFIKSIGLGTLNKKTSASLFRNQWKQFAKNAPQNVRAVGTSGLREAGTEAGQAGVSQLSKGIQLADDFENITATSYFDPAEIRDNAIAGGIVGVVTLGGGKVAGQATIESRQLYRTAATRFNSRDAESIKIVEAYFKNQENNLKGDLAANKINQDQYDNQMQELSNARNAGYNIPSNFSIENKERSFDLIMERNGLNKQLKQQDDALAQPIKDRIKEINTELAEIGKSEFSTQVIGGATKISKALDVPIEYFKDDAAVTNKLNELEQQGYNVGDKKNTNFGTIVENSDGDKFILINQARNEGKATTEAHEVLHAILSQTIGTDAELAKKIGTSLLNELTTNSKILDLTDNFATRLAGYDLENNPQNFEEVLTLLSEEMLEGRIVYNESVMERIGRILSEAFAKLTGKPITFENGKDVFNFVRDYNKSVIKGELTGRQKAAAVEGIQVGDIDSDGTRGPLASGTVVETINNIIPETITTKDQFQSDPRVFGDAFKATEKGGVIYNYVNSRSSSKEQADGTLRSIQERLLNYDPATGKSFAEFIFSNTNFARLDANKALFKESQRQRTEGTSIDSEQARQVVDPSTVSGPAVDVTVDEKVTTKIDPLSFEKVTPEKQTKIKNIVDIKSEDVSKITPKELNNRYAGKVAEVIFEVPETKITDAKKNLTYAKKIVKGVQEKSEAGNIQEFFRVGQNMKNFIKILPEFNVAQNEGDISDVGIEGESIAVDPTVKGVSVGINNRLLNYFYEDFVDPTGAITTPGGRSKGLTSQTKVKRLKPEFRNPTQEVIDQVKVDIGITPRGELNQYDRSIGQMLKGMAKLQAQNTVSRAARQKVKALPGIEQTKKRQTVANITSTKSRIMASQVFEETLNDLQKSDVATEYDAARNNKIWKRIAKDVGVDFIEATNEADRVKFKAFVLEKLPKYLPQAFFTPGTFAGAGKSGYKRNFFFLSKDELTDLIRGVEFAKENKAITAAVTKTNITTGTGKNRKVSNVAMRRFEDGTIAKENKLKQKGLEDIFLALEKMMKDDKSTIPFVISLLSSTSQYQGHFMRAASPWTFISKDIENDAIVEEHVLPASLVSKYLFASALEGKIKKNYPDVKKNYFQGILSDTNDKKLKLRGEFNYQSMPPAGWQMSDNIWARYFNTNVGNNNFGISPSDIVLINKKTIAQELNIDQYGNTVPRTFASQQEKASEKDNKILAKSIRPVKASKSLPTNLSLSKLVDEALNKARDPRASEKGISVFDFDDTVATSKSMVIVNMPNGNTKKITPAEFAKQHSTLEGQGAKFDFSEFNKVVDGKPGPLAAKMEKAINKFGNKDVFILTARPQESAQAIYDFLKGIGLEIPLGNITGLADGTPQAKARWIVGKAAEGYNDFYFADDVYKNVKAVQDALSVLDVKSKIRQARILASKDLDKDFNDIIENKTGIASEKTYGQVKGEVAGKDKGRFNIFVPPSAEDFVGLLYATLGKGKVGDSQMAWYKANLLDPYARAMTNISRARRAMFEDYKALKKQIKIKPKDLKKKVPGEPFTREQAVRVYIWNQQGMEVPGISKADNKDLVDFVNKNETLKTFADQLIGMQKGTEYAAPKVGWPAGTITTDLLNTIGTVKRSLYLQQWQENADIIFSEKNMNKLEAAFGKPYRKALEGMLARMKSGRNRSFDGDTMTGKFTDWLTGQIGTIMFFNTRSALLQLISSANFVNFTDNNIYNAAKVYANQPQYWKDVMMLMNSDFLVERRSGLRFNVNESDIADMAKQAGYRGVVSKLLQFGFLPTQIADSLAIATGGATLYRNRINTYKKQGMDQKAAEEKAFQDFREIAEEAQQSSRPDRISAQQAGPLGRIILAFGNTPMQYMRLIKKAASDIKNGRGDFKTNASKIVYYMLVQNLIFNALQQAIFAVAFGDIEEEDENSKYVNIANGMADSLLRGMGIGGAIVSIGKNVGKRIYDESQKKNPKFEKIGYEVAKLSPPLSAKLSRINQAARSYQWDKDKMMSEGLSLENPAYLAGANIIAATTNIPLDRAIKKTNNVVQATTQDLETWERFALLGGWQDWELGIEDEEKKKTKKKKSSNKKRRFVID